MAVRIKSITFDCADPYRLAQFWLQLTGFSVDPDNGIVAERAPAIERLVALLGRPVSTGR